MFRLTWRRRGQIRRETSELPVPAGVTEDRVTAAGLLLWEEHCVECAAPQCCRSGSFYAPRADRRYARFVSGITPTPAARGRFRFGAEIQIRRWGKQEAIISAQPAMSASASLRLQRVLLDGVSENPEMLQLIRELDERGILQSIAVRLQRSNQFNLSNRNYDAASFQRTSVTGFARAQAEGSCQTGSWEIMTHPTLDERRVLMDHVERRPLKSRLRQTFTGIRLASFAEAGRQQWRTA